MPPSVPPPKGAVTTITTSHMCANCWQWAFVSRQQCFLPMAQHYNCILLVRQLPHGRRARSWDDNTIYFVTSSAYSKWKCVACANDFGAARSFGRKDEIKSFLTPNRRTRTGITNLDMTHATPFHSQFQFSLNTSPSSLLDIQILSDDNFSMVN